MINEVSWVRKPTVAELDLRHKNTVIEHLDMRFTGVGDVWIEASVPVSTKTSQPHGMLHGGVSVIVGETLGSCCAAYCSQQDEIGVGIQVSANHLKIAKQGTVTGICRPIRVGRTLHVWKTDLYNNDQLISVVTLTVSIIKRNPT